MPLDLSFSKAGEGFKPFDEGIYTFRVISAEVKPNKAKTGNIIEFIFKVDDEGNEFHNRQLRDWPSLSPEALWRLRDILEAITQKPWRDDDMQLEVKDLFGLTFKGLVVTQAHWDAEKAKNGEVVNKIKDYYPADPTEWAGKQSL